MTWFGTEEYKGVEIRIYYDVPSACYYTRRVKDGREEMAIRQGDIIEFTDRCSSYFDTMAYQRKVVKLVTGQ